MSKTRVPIELVFKVAEAYNRGEKAVETVPEYAKMPYVDKLKVMAELNFANGLLSMGTNYN